MHDASLSTIYICISMHGSCMEMPLCYLNSLLNCGFRERAREILTASELLLPPFSLFQKKGAELYFIFYIFCSFSFT